MNFWVQGRKNSKSGGKSPHVFLFIVAPAQDISTVVCSLTAPMRGRPASGPPETDCEPNADLHDGPGRLFVLSTLVRWLPLFLRKGGSAPSTLAFSFRHAVVGRVVVCATKKLCRKGPPSL